MVRPTSLVIGGVVLLVVLTAAIRRLRAPSTDRRESWERHEAARRREPPVDLGDRVTVAVDDFSEHHTGERHAVCRVEGFVVFVEGLPDDCDVGDVIRAEVRSFNRGHTSATAAFLERA